MTEERPKLSEVVVVEGIHDKQRVDEAVEADVIVLGGDRLSKRVLALLRRAIAVRGAILLTDPDGAGERIRRRIDRLAPGCKHAYLPRAKAIADGGLGVEHARSEDVKCALLAARSTDVAKQVYVQEEYTYDDLLQHGLTGHPQAAIRRQRVGDALGIGYGNTKAFLHKLNAYGVTRDEFERAVERLTD
ncbi:primase/topoisomerase like protein [Alicyclobacillus hesperidum URH17-3-68]|uniref:ribonuclease M5 n=1 Tax=Alicyclobacillus hesperidum TaxID=89784 RepID=UPI000281AFBA|nr:ribonuclease M5 [Alicyclobacillus hesperidum]EJY56953.1 primase/topoisomerase like protein [Alicyclobacillus hesperidum URH17-3-68]